MGQRSQIYVRYEKDGKNYLTARYYQWNYGERMISRCRWTLEWIKENSKYDWYFISQKEFLMRYLDVNFDMKDIVLGSDIIKEYKEDDYWKDNEISLNDFAFNRQDNNDGKLFIHIRDGAVKYAFVDDECNTEEIMNAEQYMIWNCENWIESEYLDDEDKAACKANLEEIEKLAVLMSKEELEDFMKCPYEEEKR